jgi:heptosyltransferase-1
VKILLITLTSSLGEIAHAIPAVHDILRARPDARVDWVVEPPHVPLVRRIAGVADAIACPQQRWKQHWWSAATRKEVAALRARLGAEPYDAILDLQGAARSVFVSRMARGLRFAPAHATEGREHEPLAGWLVDHALRLPPKLHAVDRARALVGGMLRVAPQGPPQFGLQAAHPLERAEKPTVVFAHGSGRDAELWPVALWQQLGKRVIEAGWRIALPHVDEAEQTRAEIIASTLQTTKLPQVEVWPAQPVDRVLDRLAATQGVIGTAGGLAQVAMAMGLPQVQIHNGTDAWRTGPVNGTARQVAVEGRPVPGLDAVWSAWRQVSDGIV